MSDEEALSPPTEIRVRPGGPYVVRGGVPISRQRLVVAEHGAPVSWQTTEVFDIEDIVALCRCGGSKNKPFCGPADDDFEVRAEMVAMFERCPSGALTLRLPDTDANLEPDLPQAIAVVDDGPLFVTGGIPINRSDERPFETRNHVTLCRCWRSASKPLCDGSHDETGFTDS